MIDLLGHTKTIFRIPDAPWVGKGPEDNATTYDEDEKPIGKCETCGCALYEWERPWEFVAEELVCDDYSCMYDYLKKNGYQFGA